MNTRTGAPGAGGSAAVGGARGARTGATACRIAIFGFLFFALTGGGRVTGSDEITMLELSRALLHGGIAVPLGATLDGPDGRHYTKNTAGQAVLALPLVAAAEAVTARLPLVPARRELALRLGVSFFNGLVVALILARFYTTIRWLGLSPRRGFDVTMMLGLTTPLWVYAKTFTAEPLQALGLLLALSGATRASAGEARQGWWAALGALVAISVKLSMLPLALVCLLPLARARPTAWIVPALSVGLALAGHAAYNHARFGTVFETGYGAQATPAAYTTPLGTGLYGLLVSSGKGILWFAPALWLAIGGWGPMRRRSALHRITAVTIVAAWLVILAIYSKFEHWAGDGSFGPRYLMPVVPLGFVLVAFALDRASRVVHTMARWLGVFGLLVQLGGVGIYFGAQMREAGDYPYRRALSDPDFMKESHFRPRSSPILGHWRMLIRNTREHLSRRFPRLSHDGSVDPRVVIGPRDQQTLLHALDFWWLYALYAGVPWAPVLAGFAVLLTFTAYAGFGVLAAVDEEQRGVGEA